MERDVSNMVDGLKNVLPIANGEVTLLKDFLFENYKRYLNVLCAKIYVINNVAARIFFKRFPPVLFSQSRPESGCYVLQIRVRSVLEVGKIFKNFCEVAHVY